MHTDHLIIDGYSLIHRDARLRELRQRDLMLARQRLVREIEGVVDLLAARTTIVFDGQKRSIAQEFNSPTLHVIYSPADRTADTVIEQMVSASSRPGMILVVSSDRAVQETVSATGAQCMSCAQFLDLCGERRSHVRDRGRVSPSRGPQLGDFFPS